MKIIKHPSDYSDGNVIPGSTMQVDWTDEGNIYEVVVGKKKKKKKKKK